VLVQGSSVSLYLLQFQVALQTADQEALARRELAKKCHCQQGGRSPRSQRTYLRRLPAEIPDPGDGELLTCLEAVEGPDPLLGLSQIPLEPKFELFECLHGSPLSESDAVSP